MDDLQEMVTSFSPDILSGALHPDGTYAFPPESSVPVASVCLQDAVHTLKEARYALSEVFTHQIWYLEKRDSPNEMAAAYFGRFYAADAALRLYSAGEHLANAIIMMLEISDEDLKPYKQKGKQERISQQSIVGHFLKAQKPHHPITEAVNKLVDSKDWRDTIDYRNKWVHEQPPTVKELGIVYKRGRRWKPLPNEKGYTLGVGGGDAPEYSVDGLVGFINPAMFKFTDTLTSVVKFYTELLKDAGKRTVQPRDKGEQ